MSLSVSGQDRKFSQLRICSTSMCQRRNDRWDHLSIYLSTKFTNGTTYLKMGSEAESCYAGVFWTENVELITIWVMSHNTMLITVLTSE